MKVGIVGCGMVGSTAAYAMVMQGIGREIVLVDMNAARTLAEADDIRHAVPFAHPLELRAGDYLDLEGAHVVIITAGVGQRPGETRLQLLSRNAEVFRQVVPKIVAAAPDAVLLVATNPVDVMTHLAAKFAEQLGVPRGRVLGSGTTLDTARFRSLIGRHVGVDPHHVHGYVIGEHGDSEVLTWSQVTIGGMPLENFIRVRNLTLSDSDKAEIDRCVRRAAYTIIQGKGATYYGIGAALARIVNVILHDQRAILTVSSPHAEVAGVRDVTLALPQLVGGAGVLSAMPQPLAADECELLAESAQVIREAIDELNI